MSKQIEVEFFETEHDDEVGIVVRSSDGSKLSAQDVLDGVTDLLIQHYNYYPSIAGYENKFDA